MITRVLAAVLRSQRAPIIRVGKAPARSLSNDLEVWRISDPASRPCLFGPNLCRRGSTLTRGGLTRVSADQPATSNERRLSCYSAMKINKPCVQGYSLSQAKPTRHELELPVLANHSLSQRYHVSHPDPAVDTPAEIKCWLKCWSRPAPTQEKGSFATGYSWRTPCPFGSEV